MNLAGAMQACESLKNEDMIVAESQSGSRDANISNRLGGFVAVGERENTRCAAGGSSGCSAKRLVNGFGFQGSLGRRFGSGGDGSPVRGSAGIRLFLDAHQILVRDFPAEMLVLPALLEILFEEDGAARISHEGAGSRQKDIASAILHFYTTPEKG